MAKKDKEFIARMQGMEYALKIAKESGIEELEMDVKRRNLLNAPLQYSSKELMHFWDFMSLNLYNNMLTVSALTLHEEFGFGKTELRKFKDYFNKLVDDTLSLDYLGEHYVTLEDFAVDMNEKFDLGINVDMVSACQEIEDHKPDSNYHMVRVDRMVKELRENGYFDAAEWLEGRVDE